MKVTCLATLPVALCLAAGAAASPLQNTVFGLEPNNTKATATDALGLEDGDGIGNFGTCQYQGLNFFKVSPSPRPPGIYEYRLTQSLPGFGYVDNIDLFGRDAIDDQVLPNSIVRLSSSDDSAALPGDQFVTWYGFGKSEELYVELGNVGTCRGSTEASLSSREISPIPLAPVPSPNNEPVFVRLTAQGQGSTDMELHVLDAEFNALPTAWSDDTSFSFNTSASLGSFFAPGTYYVAVADSDIASHLPPSSLRRELKFPTRAVDFAGAIVGGSPAAGIDMTLRIDQPIFDSASTVKLDPFEVLWFTFDVGQSQSSASFCPGDGTLMACPCGQDAPPGSGMGCPNSTGRGATIVSHRTPVFTEPSLTLEDLPRNSACLTFVSLGTATPTTVFGGISCLGGGAIRLPVTAADEAGTGTLSLPLTDVPAAFLGQTVFAQAAYRDSSPGPCSVNMTSGVAFVLQ